MQNTMLRTISVSVFLSLSTLVNDGALAAFTCSYGQPACVNYSEKVVDADATCFSSYSCGYDGFVCSSDYEQLRNQYNELLSSAQDVRMNYSSTIDEHNALVGRFNNLKYDYEILLGEHDNLLLRYNTLTNQ